MDGTLTLANGTLNVTSGSGFTCGGGFWTQTGGTYTTDIMRSYVIVLEMRPTRTCPTV